MAKNTRSKVTRTKKRSYTPGAGNSSRNEATVSTEFNPDYNYVIQDLKRIGIMATSFVVILVVLSLFIN